MKSENYRHWLEAQKYQAGTITAQMHRAGRVDEHHGDLDEHYNRDRMAGLIQALTYSTGDKRQNRPNPSKIPFDGDIYNNLASYRDAVKRYRKFRDDTPEDGLHISTDKDARVATADVLRTKLLGVIEERGGSEEMQSAAGGKTGLMVRQLKRIGAGPSAREVEEFTVDTATVKAIIDVQEYAARELSQWIDKHEEKRLETLTDEQLERIAAGAPQLQPVLPASFWR